MKNHRGAAWILREDRRVGYTFVVFQLHFRALSKSNPLMNVYRLLRLLRYWPPYWGAGIRVVDFSRPLNDIEVTMRLGHRNRNYVGTHFGGNLYSMCDPWYMLILMERLGRDFIVWDQAARIDFVRPGRGLVRAHFSIPDDEIHGLRRRADDGQKLRPVFHAVVQDEAGDCVAKVEKTLYVRRKSQNDK